MLTQELIRYKPSKKNKKDKRKVTATGDVNAHKALILAGQLHSLYNKLKWDCGTSVETNETHPCDGVIVGIMEDPKVVHWDGLKPLFVEVFHYDDGATYLYHPSDLRLA